METTANVSTNLEAVTDLVLKRQLIDVQRDHAKGIVQMVLECAAEAAGPAVPLYEPNVRRINVTIESVSTLEFGHGFSDHVSYTTGWNDEAGYRKSAYGPPRNDLPPTAHTEELRGLVGHNVALWVTDDPPPGHFCWPPVGTSYWPLTLVS
ncbi:hypothetical protein [Pseudarthrobacter sp. S9]|uniref:hypothetical protein n=1 Tax=Pseudarthrobacter sp. S9 TaxID=3418421 RepID=UPI003D00A48E